jgi:hypothetical protein
MNFSNDNNNAMTLSDQALGAVMLALQNSLMHQSDIIPVLKGFEFVNDNSQGLVVRNPPILRGVTSTEDPE